VSACLYADEIPPEYDALDTTIANAKSDRSGQLSAYLTSKQ
jgi:hypothetical protein